MQCLKGLENRSKLITFLKGLVTHTLNTYTYNYIYLPFQSLEVLQFHKPASMVTCIIRGFARVLDYSFSIKKMTHDQF